MSTEQEPGQQPEDGQVPAAAGWYPHPTMAGTQAYWDGQAWTDHVAPAAAAEKPDSTKTAATLLIFIVVIAAIVLVTMALDAIVR